jgi:aminopeptidase N
MTMSRLTLAAFRSTLLGALLVGLATMAVAQTTKPPVGTPLTTQGTMKSSAKAEKGQDKAVRATDKLQNKEQRTALKAARGEPKALLKGIKLTPAEKNAQKAIQKRYTDQFNEIEKQARIGEKAGQADPSVAARVEDLRRRQRAEMRGGLMPAAHARFDNNGTAYGKQKP